MPLYKQKGSSVWWVSLSHPDHPRLRRSTGTTDRKEAQRIEDELRAELWAVAPISHSKTWGHAVSAWLDIKDRSESELLSLRKFSRHFADRPLSKINGADVERALSFCETASTYTRYRTMVVAILNVARKRKWLRELPDIPVRVAKKKARTWLTHEQWEKLYGELPKHLRAPALFSVLTGLRQHNVFGLRWSDVDLARKHVVVHPEDAKGGKGIAVPLSDDAVEVLQAQQGIHDEFVFAYRGRPMAKPKAGFRDACVRAGLGRFVEEGSERDRSVQVAGDTDADGVDADGRVRRAARSTEDRGNRDRAVAARKAVVAQRYEGFTWHGLRHTWATWHVQNGTPLGVLQRLGAWSDLRMVMNYAHHSPDYLAQFAGNTTRKETT